MDLHMSSPSRWRWFLSWSSMRMEAQVWIGLATCCAAVLWIQNGNWWVLSSWWEKWLTSEEDAFTSRKPKATLQQLVQEALCIVLCCDAGVQEGLCIGPDGKGSGSLSGTFVLPWQWERLGRGAAYNSSLVNRSSVPRQLPSQMISSAAFPPRACQNGFPFFLSFFRLCSQGKRSPQNLFDVMQSGPWHRGYFRVAGATCQWHPYRTLIWDSASHLWLTFPTTRIVSSDRITFQLITASRHKIAPLLTTTFQAPMIIASNLFLTRHFSQPVLSFHTTSDAHGAVVSYCIGTTTTQSVACSKWATKIFFTILLTCQILKKMSSLTI
jgi:hypothetical protein